MLDEFWWRSRPKVFSRAPPSDFQESPRAAIGYPRCYIVCSPPLGIVRACDSPHPHVGRLARRLPSSSPGYSDVSARTCIYTNDRVVQRANVPDMMFPPPDDEAGAEKCSEECERYMAAQSSNESFLLKPMRHSPQAEYRLVRFAAGNEKDYIDVACPEAIPFCEEVTFDGRCL